MKAKRYPRKMDLSANKSRKDFGKGKTDKKEEGRIKEKKFSLELIRCEREDLL